MADTIVIIGGGLLGMLTARELALAGRPVTLLEKGQPGRESSWAGGGILSPLYPWRYPAAITALARWGQQAYPDLCRQLADSGGIDPQWRCGGMLVLDGEERDLAGQWAEREAMALEWLDSADVHARVPGLNPALVPAGDGALWLPEVAQVRNPRLVKALQAELAALQVELRPATLVTGFQVEQQQLHGVVTGQGLVPARQAVVCGGAWSAGLLPGLSLPVQPVKGQMLLFQARPDLLGPILLHRDHYLIPRRDGHILAGSTVERVGFDKTPTGAARQDLLQAALELVPALADFPLVQHWAGLRPGSPDGIPYIGAHPHINGLWLNTGHFRNGVVLGYGSARLLADMLLQRTPILDPAPYTPQRLVD
jgi:glycine oxidase